MPGGSLFGAFRDGWTTEGAALAGPVFARAEADGECGGVGGCGGDRQEQCLSAARGGARFRGEAGGGAGERARRRRAAGQAAAEAGAGRADPQGRQAGAALVRAAAGRWTAKAEARFLTMLTRSGLRALGGGARPGSRPLRSTTGARPIRASRRTGRRRRRSAGGAFRAPDRGLDLDLRSRSRRGTGRGGFAEGHRRRGDRRSSGSRGRDGRGGGRAGADAGRCRASSRRATR